MTRNTLFLFVFVIFSASVFAQPEVITPDVVGSNARNFTDLFDISTSWLGADGIFSIPLNRNDNWGSGIPKGNEVCKTLFVFSDTMLGTADPKTKKYIDVKMVNHSAAQLSYSLTGLIRARKMQTQFIYGKNGDNVDRVNIFEKKYWLQDGIVIDNKIYLTAFTPDRRWKPTQVDMLTIPLSGLYTPNWEKTTVAEKFPIFAENERFQLVFGIGILDYVTTDGYIYVYGYRDTLQGGRKHLIAARVKPESFADAQQWRFWSGKDWEKDITVAFQDAATLAERVSTELSVTPLANGKFLLVFTQDVMSDRIAYKVGSSPVGPFGETVVFYRAPEPRAMGEGIYVYNAKAHPHLSAPGLLLISYNVNRLGGLPRNTNEYRPRFVELPVEKIN
jgi:hypothetical protein